MTEHPAIQRSDTLGTNIYAPIRLPNNTIILPVDNILTRLTNNPTISLHGTAWRWGNIVIIFETFQNLTITHTITVSEQVRVTSSLSVFVNAKPVKNHVEKRVRWLNFFYFKRENYWSWNYTTEIDLLVIATWVYLWGQISMVVWGNLSHMHMEIMICKQLSVHGQAVHKIVIAPTPCRDTGLEAPERVRWWNN